LQVATDNKTNSKQPKTRRVCTTWTWLFQKYHFTLSKNDKETILKP